MARENVQELHNAWRVVIVSLVFIVGCSASIKKDRSSMFASLLSDAFVLLTFLLCPVRVQSIVMCVVVFLSAYIFQQLWVQTS